MGGGVADCGAHSHSGVFQFRADVSGDAVAEGATERGGAGGVDWGKQLLPFFVPLSDRSDKRRLSFDASRQWLSKYGLAVGECRAVDGALDLLDQAERLYDGNFSPNVRPIATRKIQVWLAQGRLGEALGWAREQGLSVENELSYLREFDHITLARVLLTCYQSGREDGSISGVMGLLERLLKAAEEGGRMGSVIEILVLQALAHHAQGDLPAALLPLQHALALAEPEGYVRMFLDEGSSMMQLLREASAREIMPDYTDKLLAAFEAEKRKSEDKAHLPPTQPLIEPLSQRELKILQLIAQGLSNREIGERLFLALDTIKGHNRKIFDKLQVQSRTEAIARARELGLL